MTEKKYDIHKASVGWGGATSSFLVYLVSSLLYYRFVKVPVFSQDSLRNPIKNTIT